METPAPPFSCVSKPPLDMHASGPPETADQLSEGVRYWEEKDREWERELALPLIR